MTTEPEIDPRPAQVEPARLGDLFAAARAEVPDGAAAVRVGGLTLDSRSVRPGDLYAALPGGRTHGGRFATEAVRRGAAAVFTDPDGALLPELAAHPLPPVVVAEHPRSLLGELAAHVYGQPAASMLTFGITGTQGKTTVTYLLEAALRGAGHHAGLVGTTGARADGRRLRSRLTTPEAPELHALLAVMRERHVDACAVEVSSHALVQGRVDGVVFDVAVFLNLGRDHLDFHGDVESYFAAKAALFTAERANCAVIDTDDDWGRRLADQCPVPVTTFATAPGASADWVAVDVETAAHGSRFTAHGPGRQQVHVRVPLAGAFNVGNALAVAAALSAAGVDLQAAVLGLAASAGVPGRMEWVDAGQDFAALVDYAHKPDALRAVLEALRPTTTGRLLVVLGAGGERDPGKRQLMGEVAAANGDVLVVTDDNPRGEDAGHIRDELLAGARNGSAEVVEVADRAAAIGLAVARARAGDMVLVAGKGHETGQEIDGVVHPFDDRTVLREAVQSRLAAGH